MTLRTPWFKLTETDSSDDFCHYSTLFGSTYPLLWVALTILVFKGPNGERKTLNLYSTQAPSTLKPAIVRTDALLIKTTTTTMRTTTTTRTNTTKKRICLPCLRKKVSPPCRSSPTSKSSSFGVEWLITSRSTIASTIYHTHSCGH